MMQLILETIAILSVLTIHLRIVLYQRNGHRFKRSLSFLAWLIINGTFAILLYVLQVGLPSGLVGLLLTLSLASGAIVILHAKGNIAAVIQHLKHPHWTHRP